MTSDTVAIDAIQPTDALIVVDMQADFCPGGSMGVDGGDAIVPGINAIAGQFRQTFYTRDWHPPDHCSFSDEPQYEDGSWPPHCIQNTPGAEFHPDLAIPEDAQVVSKATEPDKERYSGFEGTDLAATLRARHIDRVFVCGIATDYCVRATVLDARANEFDVVLIEDLCRAVDPAGSGVRALGEMRDAGAAITTSDRLP